MARRIAAAADDESADGRVATSVGYAEAWRANAEGGWLAPDLPERFGGSGLPITMPTAVLRR